MEVPNTLVEALANYLTLKPYREVAGLLVELQKAADAAKAVRSSVQVSPGVQGSLENSI